MIPNSLLPNLRWFTIPSDAMGEDWALKSSELDQKLESYGMDLAEETVYLLYSESPDEILENNGQCLIARSVIGPKRDVEAPLSLIDWKASPVWRESLSGETLVDILEKAQEAYFKAAQGPRSLAKGFTLVVRRELRPELKQSIELILHE